VESTRAICTTRPRQDAGRPGRDTIRCRCGVTDEERDDGIVGLALLEWDCFQNSGVQSCAAEVMKIKECILILMTDHLSIDQILFKIRDSASRLFSATSPGHTHYNTYMKLIANPSLKTPRKPHKNKFHY
jgi:hypothetical protein